MHESGFPDLLCGFRILFELIAEFRPHRPAGWSSETACPERIRLARDHRAPGRRRQRERSGKAAGPEQ